MKLEGIIYQGTTAVRSIVIEEHQGGSFHAQLEHALVSLSEALAVPVPMWLSVNTREFARFHQTTFYENQFYQPVPFDRLKIRWEPQEGDNL